MMNLPCDTRKGSRKAVVVMVPALFPEMAQSAFQPLLDRLDERCPQDYASDEVRDLLFACRFGAGVLDKLRELFQGLLRRGLESRKLSLLLKEFTDTIELATNMVYPKVRSIAAGQALPEEERLVSLRTLDEYSAAAALMREEMASLQQWLERPPRQVDVASITRREGSLEPDCYQDIEEIIGQLNVGGDV